LDIESIEKLDELLKKQLYVADYSVVTTVYLAIKLGKPLLIEGEAGCGKTELAKALSECFSTRLVRLQCYEGLDSNSALYEWDYLRQLLMIRIEENKMSLNEVKRSIFSEEFLLKRPLLDALLDNGERPPVLLIDEIDRADEEFEGFLLEFLAEFQVTIPELGTVKAHHNPIVIITSNRTRELSDGIRRRCLFQYVAFPNFEKEMQIVRMKVPQVKEKLAKQVVETIEKLRSNEEIVHKPGTAETLDWISALVTLGKDSLDTSIVEQTLSCIIKSSDEYSEIRRDILASIAQQGAE
jgi:MoxR-like ATPase